MNWSQIGRAILANCVSRGSLTTCSFVVEMPFQRVLPSETLATLGVRAWPVRLRDEVRALVTEEVRETLGVLNPGTMRTLPGIIGIHHTPEESRSRSRRIAAN